MATTLKYFAQKTQDGYPIPSTMMGFASAPKADNLVEIQPKNYVAAPGQSVVPSASGLRYFVRHRADGTIIPNSLIATLNKPAGKVYEFKVITGTAIVAPSALSYTSQVGFTVNEAITPLTPTVTGTVTSYSVSPALPAGLSLNATTGIISGTPTVTQNAANYTITASNAAGSATAVIEITVSVGPQE